MATKGDKTRRSRKAAEAAAEPADAESDDRGIDEILGDLETVVTELEDGELPLEQALSRFEAGVKLARKGGRMLETVEQRVEMLLADRDETVPFAGEDDDE